MADFNCAHEFGIDDGQLDGATKEGAFVLGVEWQMVRQLAERPQAFGIQIHALNADRIRSMLDKLGRRIRTLCYYHDDPSEQWMWLSVEAK